MARSHLWGKIQEFFDNNPGEELYYKDLENKFSAARGTVRNVVPRMRHAGLIEVVYVIRRVKNGKS